MYTYIIFANAHIHTKHTLLAKSSYEQNEHANRFEHHITLAIGEN